MYKGMRILGSASLPLGLPVFAAGRALGLSGTPPGVCLIFNAVPVSSCILARILGDDHDRMTAIITIRALAALLYMSLVRGLRLREPAPGTRSAGPRKGNAGTRPSAGLPRRTASDCPHRGFIPRP